MVLLRWFGRLSVCYIELDLSHLDASGVLVLGKLLSIHMNVLLKKKYIPRETNKAFSKRGSYDVFIQCNLYLILVLLLAVCLLIKWVSQKK